MARSSQWQGYLQSRMAASHSRPRRARQVSREYLGAVTSIDQLQILEANGEYIRLIKNLRKMLKQDDALWAHPWVKQWMAR